MGILWASHSRKPFYAIVSKNQEDFAKEIEEVSKTTELLIIEDDSPRYKSGRGPVGLVGVHSDGWKYEPHAEFFFWASPKNILKASVCFFQMTRNKRNVGVCLVKSLLDSKNLFDKCAEYGVLHYVGKILNGDPRGDEYLFSVKGRKSCLKL